MYNCLLDFIISNFMVFGRFLLVVFVNAGQILGTRDESRIIYHLAKENRLASLLIIRS
jgi:hypothetical protein